MKSKETACILCSQPVEIPGFRLDTKSGQKDFCCEGCLSVYRLFNYKNIIPNKEKKNESL